MEDPSSKKEQEAASQSQTIGAILSRPPPEEYVSPFRELPDDEEFTREQVAADLTSSFPMWHTTLPNKERQMFNKAVEIMDGHQMALLADTYGQLQFLQYNDEGILASPIIRDNLVELMTSLDTTLAQAHDVETKTSIECLAHFLKSATYMCALCGLTVDRSQLSPEKSAPTHEKWRRR